MANEIEKESMPKNTGLLPTNMPKDVSFDYIKSNFFRVIHVDGVHGGITPKGEGIQIAFFSERSPIPKSEKYALSNGKLSERLDVKVRKAIVREVEIEAILSLEMAKKVEVWLRERIQEIEQLIQMKGQKDA